MRKTLQDRMENKMNRINLLLTCSVVAFLGATGTTIAQQERLPQHERSAPAEKIAPQNAPGARNHGPNSRADETLQNRGHSETTGQAPQEGRQSRPSERNPEQERGKVEPPARSERTEQNRATGQAPPEQNRTTSQAPREDGTNRSSEQNRLEGERGRTDRTEENRATTGQGAAGTRSNATVNITPEKRTRIHEVIVNERNAPRISSPNFNVSVGAQVPRTVRFAALPRTIVEIEPDWRGFEYFMIGDQIVIVDPKTMEIVAVLDA
jgi:Protein of unknown function (DUF1236)